MLIYRGTCIYVVLTWIRWCVRCNARGSAAQRPSHTQTDTETKNHTQSQVITLQTNTTQTEAHIRE